MERVWAIFESLMWRDGEATLYGLVGIAVLTLAEQVWPAEPDQSVRGRLRNLVFLVDVSGSMQGTDRLGLVQYGMTRLVESLRPIDRVSIVVYAGASGLVLPPTPGNDEDAIVSAIEHLEAKVEAGTYAAIAIDKPVTIFPDGSGPVVIDTTLRSLTMTSAPFFGARSE